MHLAADSGDTGQPTADGPKVVRHRELHLHWRIQPAVLRQFRAEALDRASSASCGSGKKYKHCCLNAGSAAPADVTDLTWRRLREQLKGYPTAMLRFVKETYGPSALHEAWEEFAGHDGVAFNPETPLIQLFMPWFFHCWTPDPHATSVEDEALVGVIPTAAYLAAKERRLDPLLRRYLESLLSAPLTFFEVVSCDPGAGPCETIRVKDGKT